MKVFDFDNTIYDGESLFDFFTFITKKNKKALLYIPVALKILLQYKLKLITDENVNSLASKFTSLIVKDQNQLDLYIKEFWDLNRKKLKPEFLRKLKRNDVIITASPSLLMDGIKEQLKGVKIIASEFNLETNQFDFLCLGENKVKKFESIYGKRKKIKEFYTDSLNDLPMVKKAKKAYMVKNNKIKRIKIIVD